MKKIALAAAIAGALLAPSMLAPAVAADMPAAPVYRAPVVLPAFNWSGFYVGGHGGWGTGNASADSWGYYRSPSIDGWFGGGQAGYNWQEIGSPWVFGVEADISAGGIEGTQPFLGTTIDTSLHLFGTVRGRIGYAFDRVMVYGTGGWAWGKNDVTINGALSDTASLSGWTAGGGVEWAFFENWTAKIEYLYLSYSGSNTLSNWVVGGVQTDLDAHTIRFGINYRFGGYVSPVSAVSAKY